MMTSLRRGERVLKSLSISKPTLKCVLVTCIMNNYSEYMLRWSSIERLPSFKMYCHCGLVQRLYTEASFIQSVLFRKFHCMCVMHIHRQSLQCVVRECQYIHVHCSSPQ